MANDWVNRWTAKSETSDEEYTIGLRSDGTTWGCSCPAWRFARAPKPDCKHIKAFKENLGVLPPALAAERVAAERQSMSPGRLGVAAGGVSAIAAAIAKVKIGNVTMTVESILLQPAKRKFRTIE